MEMSKEFIDWLNADINADITNDNLHPNIRNADMSNAEIINAHIAINNLHQSIADMQRKKAQLIAEIADKQTLLLHAEAEYRRTIEEAHSISLELLEYLMDPPF